MRQLYKENIYEDIGFSKNGTAAYLRGERPQFMIDGEQFNKWARTGPHHVEVKVGKTFKRPLVMFYRRLK